MPKSMGRMIFVAVLWLFALRYYLECMGLSERSEKLTINIAFWIMTILAAWELLGLVRSVAQNRPPHGLIDPQAIRYTIKDQRSHLVVAVILYVFLIPLAGFYVTSFVAFCVFSFILGNRSLLKMVVPSCIIMAFIYGLFTTLLQLPLPAGLLM